MKRIDNSTAVGNRFVDGSPSAGQAATVVPAQWLNVTQEEIIAVLTAAGITPDQSGEDQDQLLEAINYLIAASVPGGSNLPSFITGAYISNGTDTDHDIDITPGAAYDSATSKMITLGTAFTKQIDAVWAEGTGLGGLDTGAVANDTTYHVFIISKDDGTTDALFSTNPTSPTMPSGYTNKRRVGSVLTDGSANIIQFVRSGDYYGWKTVERDISSTITSTSTLFTLKVPTGLKLNVHANFFGGKAGTSQFYVSDPDKTDQVADQAVTGFTSYNPVSGGADVGGSVHAVIPTNTSGQVKASSTTSGVTFYASTLGFEDRRDK